MNEYHRHIIDAVENMRREGYGRQESVQVYLASDVYRAFREDEEYREFNTPDSERRIQTEPLGAGSPTKAAFGEDVPEFDTYSVIHLDGMVMLHEPRLNDGEILLLDQNGFMESSTGLGIMLEHPVCVEKIRTRKTPEKQSTGHCDRCGSSIDVAVEGDEGELFCSIDCLNEVYS